MSAPKKLSASLRMQAEVVIGCVDRGEMPPLNRQLAKALNAWGEQAAALEQRVEALEGALREIRPAFVDLRHGEDCSRTESCEDATQGGTCDGGPYLDRCPRESDPGASCCDRHGHKGCPECSCTVECLHIIDAALAGQPEAGKVEACVVCSEFETDERPLYVCLGCRRLACSGCTENTGPTGNDVICERCQEICARCTDSASAPHPAPDAVKGLVDGARLSIRRGHHDTCSHALVNDGECDCGHDAIRAALALLDKKEGK